MPPADADLWKGALLHPYASLCAMRCMAFRSFADRLRSSMKPSLLRAEPLRSMPADSRSMPCWLLSAELRRRPMWPTTDFFRRCVIFSSKTSGSARSIDSAVSCSVASLPSLFAWLRARTFFWSTLAAASSPIGGRITTPAATIASIARVIAPSLTVAPLTA